MNLLSIILVAPPEGSNSESGVVNLVFLAAIFLVFYWFFIRPQSRKRKEISQKVTTMKKGDKIVTNTGIIGVIDAIEGETVLVEVDENAKIRFYSSAINDVNPEKY